MIKTNYLVGCLSVALLLTSCRTDDAHENGERIVNSTEAKSNLIVEAKGFEQFAKDNGLKLVASFPMKNKEYAKADDNNFTFNTIKEKVTSDHLTQLGLTEHRLMDYAKQDADHALYIDGVTINDYKTSGAYSEFNLAERYDWKTYIETGNPIISTVNGSDADNVKVIMSGTEVVAGTSGNPNYEKAIEYTQESILRKTIDINAGLKTGTEFGIYGQGVKVEIALENKNSKTTETKDINKLTEKITYSIPANKKIAIYMIQTIKKREIQYKVPVFFSGVVCINYNTPVDGSHFSSFYAEPFFRHLDLKQVGTVSQELYTDVKVFIKELNLNEKAPDIKTVFNLNKK
ncbi:hypothetical protein D1631_12845 [Chryseobacterium nematophagum]|uniref:Uncharacterized protein n=1 Tax=Chryseobacterium nematophagum TaxID=2305228 RepID=A0A3M7TKM3_9FLAO|nr:hypothetical protein [Chryseobacterium nematophagum]RNA62760.1 hypothetical protein D1631_12845 [Chryseobacterium nematophagum]